MRLYDMAPVGASILYGGLLAQGASWEAALLTVAVETPLFWLAGYRRAADCLRFALVNIASNLLLNEALAEAADSPHYGAWLLLGEFLVLALEFALCRRFLPATPAPRLLRVLLVTNAASFLAGLYFFQ